MKSRTATLAVAGAVVLGSIGGVAVARSVSQQAAPGHSHSRDHAQAGSRFLGTTWAYRPQNLAEMTARSTAVVVAEVTGVRDAAPLALPPGTPDAATAAIPTQRIAVRVTDVLAGDAPATFELFRTGDSRNGLYGDPAYAVGETYVLFVRPRAGTTDGSYLPVAPDGRLGRGAAGALRTFIPGHVADEIKGWSFERLVATVTGGTAR